LASTNSHPLLLYTSTFAWSAAVAVAADLELAAKQTVALAGTQPLARAFSLQTAAPQDLAHSLSVVLAVLQALDRARVALLFLEAWAAHLPARHQAPTLASSPAESGESVASEARVAVVSRVLVKSARLIPAAAVVALGLAQPTTISLAVAVAVLDSSKPQ
jgi:hypothetical protein